MWPVALALKSTNPERTAQTAPTTSTHGFGSPSNAPCTHLLRQILRGAHGQRKNCHRGILPTTANKTASVHHKQVLDIVALVPLVQHACLRVIPHAASTHFVNAVAGRIRLIIPG